MSILRKVPLGVVLGWAVLSMGGPALADSPTVIHDRISDGFTDTNFCGSGLTVEVMVEGVQNIRVGQESFKATGHLRSTITNPVNGKSVLVSVAGQMDAQLISGDPSGLHTVLLTFRGLPEKIQSVHGEVLLRDAGTIGFADTFDGDQFVGTEFVFQKGPHPEADSEFQLFCGTIASALS